MALQRISGWLRGGFTLPLAVLAAGVGLSIAMSLAAREDIERSAQQRFDAQATDAARRVEDRFDAYTEVLIGLRALFDTTDEVSPEQFRHYVAGLRLASHFPGFQVLNYAPVVVPSGHHAISLIEPLAGNENAIGRDIGAVPAGLKALEQARDTGGLTSSGRKIRIHGRESDIGLAIRLPVYRSGMPLDTVEQRRAAYRGSVGAGFRIADMMRALGAEDMQAGRRLQLFDAGPSAGRVGTRAATRIVEAGTALTDDMLLYDSAAAQPRPAQLFERTLAFELGGRSWVVRFGEDARQVVGRLDRSIPWLIFASGAAMSLLLAGIIYSQGTSRRRAEGIALAMTRNLRTSQRRLDEAQNLASLGSWVLEPDTGALYCSDEAARIFGVERNGPHTDLATLMSRIPREERAAVERHVAQAYRSQERAEFEHRLVLPDGTERWVQVIVQVSTESGKPALRGTVRDDTQRRKAALRLELEHQIAQLLVADGDTEPVITRALQTICTHLRWDCAALWAVQDGGVVRCGASWHDGGDASLEQFVRISRSTGYRPDEGSLGLAWVSADAVVVDTAATRDQFARDALAAQAGLRAGLVVPMVACGRATALELFSRAPHASDAETVESLRAIALQITQYEHRKHAEQTLRYVATHDALTGLANRTSLQRDLARAIKRSHRHQKPFAVMFVDIDRFKRINDTLGHGAGDAMIKACGERLVDVLREDDAVARFGGDEFVLIIENLSKASDAAVVAEKVLACCAEPYVIHERELHVTSSIGVSIYPEDGADAETLLKNADTAMYRAKDRGPGGYQFYSAQMNAQGSERLALEAGLRRATERGELELHYQPKMDLRTERIAGVEALMRWRHPVLGLLSPAQFIPIAEETGLIVEMGRWALQTACADAREWQRRGLPAVQMSVNVSPRQLNGTQLIDDINEVLNSTGLNPALLELEITESAMMKNPEQAAALLQEIRRMGVGLAIDDFGTGYSSLSYLKRFPLTTVKIDRSFVNDLSQDRDAEALTDGIVTLAHGLRMRVVAEGVETAAQLAYLRAHDCDEVQGYWLCKPIPADEVCAFMARHLRSRFLAPVAA